MTVRHRLGKMVSRGRDGGQHEERSKTRDNGSSAADGIVGVGGR
jgi:hypothetical protein